MSSSEAAAPELTLIVAMDTAGVIGAEGGMPWHIPDDLRWFKAQTRGKPILMGRRTFDSIGRALPQRHNLVLTRDPGFAAPGCERVADLDEAIAAARADGAAELMVIGGAQVYALSLARAHRLLVTHIDGHYAGDTHFPAVDWSAWRLVETQSVAAAGEVPAHRFMTWVRAAA